MAITGSEAVYNTHRWFERNSGWAPPDPGTLAEWMADGVCRCPDDCEVAPPVPCRHGLASWWLVLRCLDRPAQVGPIPPAVLAPHPDRLDPERGDYIAVIDAHHEALERGASGYSDPGTGLFVQTARTLWDRDGCCEQGCRHCPFLSRGRFEG